MGEIIARGKAFEEDLIIADLNVAAVGRARLAQGRKKSVPPRVAALVDRIDVRLPAGNSVAGSSGACSELEPLDEAYRALVLGVQDYVRKNGFKRVVIGLSGGSRLGHHGSHCGRCPRRGERARGFHAIALHLSKISREDVGRFGPSASTSRWTRLSITSTFK